MINEKHLARLQRLYAGAPSSLYQQEDISVLAGQARIRLDTEGEDLDAAGRIDRAVYFKVLCDASSLAAGSLVEEQFVTIETFDLSVVRSVSGGEVVAHARVVSARESVFTVEAVLADGQGRKLASAHGVFTKSTMPLPEPGEQTPTEAEDAELPVAYASVWDSPYGFVFLN